MELEMVHRIKINLAHHQKLQIEVPVFIRSCHVSVKEVHTKACAELGLKPDNWKYFVVVEVIDGLPVKKCKPEDDITLPLPVIYLSKWLFDLDVERKLLSDPAAVRLLHLAAQDLVHCGHLSMTHHEMEQLEECEDPSFYMEIQYVKLCQKLPHYLSRLFPECTVVANFPLSHPKVKSGDTVNLFITKSGIQLHKDECGYYLFWNKVKCWSCHHQKQEIKFEVSQGQTYSRWLSLVTPQCRFVMALISEVISDSQRKHCGLPGFLTSMIHHVSTVELAIDNPLFAPTAQDNPIFLPAIEDDILAAGDRCNNLISCRKFEDLSAL